MAIYPNINGTRYDWSSIEIAFALGSGGSYSAIGAKELNYSDKLEPGKVKGTAAQPLGRTRGEYEAEGSITLFKQEWGELVALLVAGNIGYMEAVFQITVHYNEPTVGIMTDTLIGCRIKGKENSPSQGSEPVVVKADLDIMYILDNGQSPLTNLRR